MKIIVDIAQSTRKAVAGQRGTRYVLPNDGSCLAHIHGSEVRRVGKSSQGYFKLGDKFFHSSMTLRMVMGGLRIFGISMSCQNVSDA